MSDSTKTRARPVVRVTRAQVQAARLRKDLLEAAGQPVDEKTGRIAQVNIPASSVGRTVNDNPSSAVVASLREFLATSQPLAQQPHPGVDRESLHAPVYIFVTAAVEMADADDAGIDVSRGERSGEQ